MDALPVCRDGYRDRSLELGRQLEELADRLRSGRRSPGGQDLLRARMAHLQRALDAMAQEVAEAAGEEALDET